MDYTSSAGGLRNDVGGTGGIDSSQRDNLMGQVKAQIAIANAQELLQVNFKHQTKLKLKFRNSN